MSLFSATESLPWFPLKINKEHICIIKEQHQNTQTKLAGTSLGYSHKVVNANCQLAPNPVSIWFYKAEMDMLFPGCTCLEAAGTGLSKERLYVTGQ